MAWPTYGSRRTATDVRQTVLCARATFPVRTFPHSPYQLMMQEVR